MKTNRPFNKTYNTPIELVKLLQSRGLFIKDVDSAARFIQNIGYYRLSAYMYPLLSVIRWSWLSLFCLTTDSSWQDFPKRLVQGVTSLITGSSPAPHSCPTIEIVPLLYLYAIVLLRTRYTGSPIHVGDRTATALHRDNPIPKMHCKRYSRFTRSHKSDNLNQRITWTPNQEFLTPM